MVASSRWKSIALISIGLLLTLVFAVLFTADLAFAGDDLLEAFNQTHAEIIAQVKKGKLSAEVGAKADEMRIGLKKYLIKTEAQMEILQLDVLYGSGEKQETSLKKLLALSAAQERTKVVYLQRLQALKAGKTKGKELVPPLPAAQTNNSFESETKKAGSEQKPEKEAHAEMEAEGPEVKIRIKAEDLSTGQFP